jgi:hypothetical protein
MNIPLIIKEIKKLLPEDTHEHLDYKKWKVYCTLSGSDEDGYFDLYFRETLSGKKSVEIARETDEPLKYVEIIKKIEPKAVILYYKTTQIEVIA